MPDRRDNPFSSRPPRETGRTRSSLTSNDLLDELDDDEDAALVADEHQVFGLGIQQASLRQPTYGQGVMISLLSAAALLLLAIIAIGEGETGDPPAFRHTGMLYWAIAAVVLIATAFGAHLVERTAIRAAEADSAGGTDAPRKQSINTAWVLPAVSVIAAVLLTATFNNRWMLLFGPLIAFLGTAGAILSRDLLDEADATSIRVAATIHTVVLHTIAFLAFSAVYLNKFSNWLAVPVITIIAGLLTLDLLERAGTSSAPRAGFALLTAWILGLTTIALNWWPAWGWTGGAVLLAVFYMFAGLLQTRAEDRPIQLREIVEFMGIGGLAIVILALRDVLL